MGKPPTLEEILELGETWGGSKKGRVERDWLSEGSRRKKTKSGNEGARMHIEIYRTRPMGVLRSQRTGSGLLRFKKWTAS